MTSALESAPDSVTLADAAEQLGVHYMTAYRYVRTGRMLAEKRGGKWWVAPDALAAVLEEGTGARRRAGGIGGESRAAMVDPLIARMLVGDTAGCWELISSCLSSGATPAEVHTQLLQAALERIGESWRRGELTVADEHRATATTSRLLGQMGPLFRHRGRRRGTVVLGSVPGDHHALPSAMMADLLSDRRFDVIDLGANTPVESFVDVITAVDNLVGVGLCVVLDVCVGSALEQARALRKIYPDVFMVVGGPAVQRSTLEADLRSVASVVSCSADDACAAFEAAAGNEASMGDAGA